MLVLKVVFKCRITLFAFYCHDSCVLLLDKRKQAGAFLRVSVLWLGALLTFGSSRAAPLTPRCLCWGSSDAGCRESRGSESTGKLDVITTDPESQQSCSFEVRGATQCWDCSYQDEVWGAFTFYSPKRAAVLWRGLYYRKALQELNQCQWFSSTTRALGRGSRYGI